MKKILVFSDSHGVGGNIDRLARLDYDVALFAGDGIAQAENFRGVYAVRGNCDPYGAKTEQLITVDGVKIFLTHGNAYSVKSGLNGLYYRALEAGADIAVYGHTHVQSEETIGKTLLLCPGSIGYRGDYAVIYVDDGNYVVSLLNARDLP